MELLDRYLLSVKQELQTSKGGKGIRDNESDDIIREIKANILDELEAREEKGELKESALADILQDYGHPCALAQRYAPLPPLVSGADMPLYKTVLWHGAALIFVFALLKTLNSMLQSDSINPLRLLFQTGGNFLENAALMLVVVTLAFYYLAKNTSVSALRYRNWTPANLPQNPLATIKLSDTLTDLTSAAFLLLLSWTSVWMSESSQENLLLALSPEQNHWRIIFTVLCILSVLFAIYRLTQSYWKSWSLVIYVAEHLLFGLAFLWMASISGLFVISNEEVVKNWPFISEFVDTQLQYCLGITGMVILILGALQARKFKMLKH